MINKLSKPKNRELNNFEFVALKCLEVLIYSKENYEESDVMEELEELE